MAAAQGDQRAAAWHLTATAAPTNLVPGAPERAQAYFVIVTNVGSVDADGPITVSIQLPDGLSVAPVPQGCEVADGLVTCTREEVVDPGEQFAQPIPVTVDPSVAGDTLQAPVTVEGGGVEPVESVVETKVGYPPPEFGFLTGPSGLSGFLGESDGSPSVRAGSTPYMVTIDTGLPSRLGESQILNAGQPRDLTVDLPAGLIIDPAATPHCRERQLELGSCPPASQVGTIAVATSLSPVALEVGPLYNVVPPPGSASNFAFKVKSTGSIFRLLGSVRTGDYGLSASAESILGKYSVLGVHVQLWGYPADPAHDASRGAAVESGAVPLITLPSACGPLSFAAHIDSWEQPGSFVSRTVAAGEGAGGPFEVEGCSSLAFDPSVTIQPTTAAADSASGLDATVVVPQRVSSVGSATAGLRGATVTLPAGAVFNPAAAVGLESCSPAQIGLVTAIGQGEAKFDGAAAGCPNSAKLGTVEATTRLLEAEAEDGMRSSGTLSGSIYLAQPGQNPFGSTFALYAVLEDPERGIVIKAPGRVSADPATGRLAATFSDLPQLPFEEFKLDFFGGPNGILRTPTACGDAVSRAELQPWSSPSSVARQGRFSISVGAGGSPCPTPGQLPNVPRLAAGTVSPAAGSYSPFVLELSRDDGTQELAGLNVTLPAGLAGRLAGTSSCPEADIAAESCPASSAVGRLVVAVGAGSNPYEAEGHVYLAGPYKGAPFSLVTMTPAVAGPFDFGSIVVRAAVAVDPITGQLSATSDPLPTILAGVPLDVRAIKIELGKTGLIRNPTSCDAGAVAAEVVSTSGQIATRNSRFQVGDCKALAFRPRLSLKVSGAIARNGHPSVRAALHTNPSGAALRGASFTLPASELLDLGHLRELCPRSEAVGRCPASSRLGSLRLQSPLLEAPLKGAVYLRVPRHRLPDLSAELHADGLSFVLSGRTTNSGGRLGISLRSLPDIPISSAVLRLAGGRRGILVNSHSLCRKSGQVAASFSAHDGKRRRLRVPVRVEGCH